MNNPIVVYLYDAVPVIPTNLRVIHTTQSSITATWEDPIGRVDSYRVIFKKSKNSEYSY